MPIHQPHAQQAGTIDVRPQFTQSGELHDVPRFELPRQEMPADSAYQIVHDELMLDGNARLNLATFVTTWMEPAARVLMAECLDKNMIDKDEYPQTAELERRCVAMLARLWDASHDEPAVGCSTTGSSEAAMLGGMALKRRWAQRRRGAGLVEDRPNLVMGANVQVCWEKFCRYWDVEPRLVAVGADSTCLTAEGAAAQCDEHTIGVVAILGSTFDGAYEPVREIARRARPHTGGARVDVPIHVDAASGGFVAPFIDPELEWDFRIARVASINASGHKYGLVYPGVGWAIWRDSAALPEDLVFHVDYLGGDMPTFALNFSRPGAQVVAQYYTLLRLGSTATGACSRDAVTTHAGWHLRSRRSVRSNCSPTAATCPSSRSGCVTTSTATRSSTSPRRCGSRVGSCPPTHAAGDAGRRRAAGRRAQRLQP